MSGKSMGTWRFQVAFDGLRRLPCASKNQALAELFSQLQKHYEALQDGWRERSYRTTASREQMNGLIAYPMSTSRVVGLLKGPFLWFKRDSRIQGV